MGKMFGTDGVRGVANTELTPELAFELGKAGAYVLAKENPKPVIIIGKDTRISGDMFEASLSSGILSMGGSVIKVGVLPTPAIAYLVQKMDADAGVVISASHNPFEDNGIKFFNGKGFKLDDSLENEIEEIIESKKDISSHIQGERIGRSLEAADNALELYAEFLKTTIDIDLKGMRIVIDCANGAAYKVAEKVFRELGADVTVLFNQPDGININNGCGSTHPETLCAKVKELGADIGLAFDGDADRLIAVDENGEVVNGDQVIFICAKMMKEEGTLAKNKVTATVMSNMGLYKAVENMGCEMETTQVGDRYVLESMLKTGSFIGGEQSGHIIFLNHATTGDGILAALQLLKTIKKTKRTLSSLASDMTVYPQVLINAKIKNENKKTYMENQEVRKAIEDAEKKMAGDGRVLIRPSGTEPLVRVMLEGSDQNAITKIAEELAKLITSKLG